MAGIGATGCVREDSGAAVIAVGAGLSCGGAGNLRTVAFTSGFGVSVAINSSIAPFALNLAAASTVTQFSSVRCGARRLADVSVSAPSSSASRLAGSRRAARATSIRL